MGFFDAKYNREPARNDIHFGIVDRDAEPYARSTADHADDPWDAIVKNPSAHMLHFIPIDRNIVIKKNGNQISLSEGLLHKMDNSYLAFVEIKNRKKSDFKHAKEQLASTINEFVNNHNPKVFGTRKAYIADHRHPNFQVSHKVEMNEFRSKYGFRLLYQNTIEVE